MGQRRVSAIVFTAGALFSLIFFWIAGAVDHAGFSSAAILCSLALLTHFVRGFRRILVPAKLHTCDNCKLRRKIYLS